MFAASLAAHTAHSQTLQKLAAYQGADRQQLLMGGARREGPLLFYATFPVEYADQLIEPFRNKYGIKVEYWRARSEIVLRKVITEAREGGTAGIFDSSGGMRTELIGEIAMTVGPSHVVFEAPTKAAQAWFIKTFGPSVNLGNIPPEEVIPLATLRYGLRGDTLKEVLLGERAGTPAP